MGILTTILAYKVGRNRGRKQGYRLAEYDSGTLPEREDCVNYHLFCKNFGSCDGQICEPIGCD